VPQVIVDRESTDAVNGGISNPVSRLPKGLVPGALEIPR
jgi:hypothetical protein